MARCSNDPSHARPATQARPPVPTWLAGGAADVAAQRVRMCRWTRPGVPRRCGVRAGAYCCWCAVGRCRGLAVERSCRGRAVERCCWGGAVERCGVRCSPKSASGPCTGGCFQSESDSGADPGGPRRSRFRGGSRGGLGFADADRVGCGGHGRRSPEWRPLRHGAAARRNAGIVRVACPLEREVLRWQFQQVASWTPEPRFLPVGKTRRGAARGCCFSKWRANS